MKKILLLFAILLGVSLYILTDSMHYHVIILLISTVLGVFFYRGDILYPFTWFSPIVILYNVSIYILELSGLRIADHFETVLNSLYLSVIIFFFFCFFFIKQLPKYYNSFKLLSVSKEKVIFNLMIVFALYLVLCFPVFFMAGYTSKLDMNMKGGIMGLGIFSNLFLLLYLYYYTYRVYKTKSLPMKLFVLAILLSLSISLVIGERELFLTIVLGSFLVYYFFFKISKKKIILFTIVGVALVAVLGESRQITNQGGAKSEKTLEEKIFGGEFITSGRNFNTILDDREGWRYQYGVGLYNDVVHSLIPSFIINVQNTTGWYNERYNPRRDEGFGAGFSFLAEGYLQCGYIGVCIWTILLAWLVRFLYNNSNQSVFGLAIYIFMITDIMYSMRGDFSYILSPLIKQVFFSYLLIKVLSKRIVVPRNRSII